MAKAGGNGYSTKEMLDLIYGEVKESKKSNEKLTDRFNDYIEKHNKEHASIWDAFRNLKGGITLSALTVAAGIVVILIKLYI